MAVGLLAGTVSVAVGVILGVAVSVGVIPLVGVLVGGVGVAPGVDVSVGVIPTVGVFVAVTVGVLIAVGVTVGRVVAVGVTTTVGVTAGSVGDGVGKSTGVTVTPDIGVFCRCAGVAEALTVGTLVRPLLLVASTSEVCPFSPVGLARQGLGGLVGVASTRGVATAVGTVAVIKTELTTRVSSPPVLPCANSEPQALPTVTKSRDILMLIQKKVTTITIKRPLAPRFHRAINVSIISLLSFPQHCQGDRKGLTCHPYNTRDSEFVS
jgi:hypothetical protein